MNWKKILAQGFASSSELLTYLRLPQQMGSTQAEKLFRTRVPRGFAARMQPENPLDPLLLQVLASDEERITSQEYLTDPLLEQTFNPVHGVLHKYHARVLITLTGACAIHCRYCFRRHFPYEDNNPGRHGWQPILEYIRKDTSIREVILSGGDPLLVSDASLRSFIESLHPIPHVHTLRIHSRLPIVLPERIDDALLSVLKACPLRKVIVLHCNHAQEINHDVIEGCRRLIEIDCLLLNQSVLLKGINDQVETLVSLSERLFFCRVMPYYLHVLDKVAGASHFDMPLQEALTLYHALQAALPGYLLPRLVREDPGEKNKTLLT